MKGISTMTMVVSKPVPRSTGRSRPCARDSEPRQTAGRANRTRLEIRQHTRLQRRILVERESPTNLLDEQASCRVRARTPNVLFVVLDDVGFGWSQTFGGLVETPNLTRLARGGIRYVNHHAPASSTAARTCLLTGRNHDSGERTDLADRVESAARGKGGLGAMLREHGYGTLALGAWHDGVPKTGGLPVDPHEWPTSAAIGFDRFHGLLDVDGSSAALADQAASFIARHQSWSPEKPWLCHLCFGGCRGVDRVDGDRLPGYAGKFDMGWDAYRDLVLERQKRMGLIPAHAELAPRFADIPPWDRLSIRERHLLTRVAELRAAYLSHTDAGLGRLLEFLDQSEQIDDTLMFVLLGPGGDDARESGLVEALMGASNARLSAGWALAANTPFRACEKRARVGGTQTPLIIHWPNGIRSKGEIRTQFHHVIDVVPTVLTAAGCEPPNFIDGIEQAPIEGVSMNYSFDDPNAPTRHVTQHFELLGNRAIVDGRWKAVTRRRRTRGGIRFRFDEDHWELYDLASDPSECHDLMAVDEVKDPEHPTARKLLELVGLWWSEARRFGVLPLDVGSLPDAQPTGFDRSGREPEKTTSNGLSRSWTLTVQIEIPPEGAAGPIVAMGNHVAGWCLYLKDNVPTFCQSSSIVGIKYVRGVAKLAAGRHLIRYEFEKRPTARHAGGGVARLVVDGRRVAEEELALALALDSSLEESLNIGSDKGCSPVTDEYPPLASFTGRLLQVDMNLHPDFARDTEAQHAADARPTVLRQ